MSNQPTIAGVNEHAATATPATPAKSKPKGKSDKKGNGDKKGKSGKAKKGESRGPSIAGHPRARAAIRRAKGFGGLLGFAIAAYVSLKASVPPQLVGLRALAAGVAGYMLAWGCAVIVWRQIVLAELKSLSEKFESDREKRDDA
jgi:hypothetical protein